MDLKALLLNPPYRKASGYNREGRCTQESGFWSTPWPPYSLASIAAGKAHTCGVTGGGVAYCWGSNYDGQLGNGTASGIEASPVRTAGTLSFVQISAGGRHTCALTSQGGAHCWGFGGVGELGTGTSSSESEPSAVVHP